MARIYIVGGSLWQPLANSLDAVLIPVPERRIDGVGIHDFLMESFRDEVGCLILHADVNPQLCMAIALHLRMTPSLPGDSYLCPIVFVTSLSHENFLKQGIFSQIFLTEKVEFCAAHELASSLKLYTPMMKESYRSDFLDRITITRPEGNNHSLANQWGASRVYELVTGRKIPESAYRDFSNIQKELYYKYILQKINRTGTISALTLPSVENSRFKHILLIDDEADKGWTRAIESLFPDALFHPVEDVISERVHCYEDLSESAREKIECGDYDLILLVLRLGGVSEDKIVDPSEFSGYKILKHIKSLNRGSQVIMLTASNKAWNLKALLNPSEGASGYFIKESPEYEFTDEFSIANIRSFLSDAQLCFDRSYLRPFYRFIQSIKPGEDQFLLSLLAQLSMAFDMMCQAKDVQGYNYAFIALSQVAEIITSGLTDVMTIDGNRKELWFKDPSDGRLTERCRRILPKRRGLLSCLSEDQYMVTNDIKLSFSQKEKMTCLSLQRWSNKDDGLMYLFGQFAQIRNAFIHKDNRKMYDESLPIIGAGFASHHDFMDETLGFNDGIIRQYLMQASVDGFLFEDQRNGHFTISRDIINGSLGLKLFAEVLRRIIENLL